MEKKLQKQFRKIRKKKGGEDTEHIQSQIDANSVLALKYAESAEVYKHEIEEVNDEILRVKDNLVKLESRYMLFERKIQDDFRLELERKQKNLKNPNSKVASTPSTQNSLDGEISYLTSQLREAHRTSDKQAFTLVNLEAKKRVLENQYLYLTQTAENLAKTEKKLRETKERTLTERKEIQEKVVAMRNQRKAEEYKVRVAQQENVECRNERDVLKAQVAMLETKVVGMSMTLVSDRATLVDIASQTLFANRKVKELENTIEAGKVELQSLKTRIYNIEHGITKPDEAIIEEVNGNEDDEEKVIVFGNKFTVL